MDESVTSPEEGTPLPADHPLHLPYARAMGMEIDRIEDGVPVIGMDYTERAVGRPGYLHGGAIGGCWKWRRSPRCGPNSTAPARRCGSSRSTSASNTCAAGLTIAPPPWAA
jgi:hypothetical protein